MFKTSTFVGFILFFIGLFFWLWHFVSMHKLDYSRFGHPSTQQTTHQNTPRSGTRPSKGDISTFAIYQTRDNLIRQIYTSHGDFLLETTILADHSLLQLIPDGGKMELLERLENLEVASQEKIQVKNNVVYQTIDYLQAEEATWRQKTATLVTDKGTFSILESKGAKLPSMKVLATIHPILKTHLEQMRLWFEEGKPRIDAEGVAASLPNF